MIIFFITQKAEGPPLKKGGGLKGLRVHLPELKGDNRDSPTSSPLLFFGGKIEQNGTTPG